MTADGEGAPSPRRSAAAAGLLLVLVLGGLRPEGAAFGLGHAYQGLGGVVLTGSVGALFGGLYLLFGRNLCVVILAHGTLDTLSILAGTVGAPGAA